MVKQDFAFRVKDNKKFLDKSQFASVSAISISSYDYPSNVGKPRIVKVRRSYKRPLRY